MKRAVVVVIPARFELTTSGLGNLRSILLSYGTDHIHGKVLLERRLDVDFVSSSAAATFDVCP